MGMQPDIPADRPPLQLRAAGHSLATRKLIRILRGTATT